MAHWPSTDRALHCPVLDRWLGRLLWGKAILNKHKNSKYTAITSNKNGGLFFRRKAEMKTTRNQRGAGKPRWGCHC